MKKINSEMIKNTALMVFGSGLMALSVKCLFDKAGMVNGGFSGISIVIRHLTTGVVEGGVPLWLTMLLLNIPLFIAAWKILGFKFIGKTIFTSILLSVWLYILPEWLINIQDNLLVAVSGGILSGAAVGMVFLAKASTGGTDSVASIIGYYRRDISMVRILQIVDGIIIVAAGFVFGVEKALYALIATYLTGRISELILEGFDFAKQVFIISDYYQEISDKILNELNRGLTLLPSVGAYTGKNRQIVYCIVTKKQVLQIKEIVRAIDEDAFVVMSDVREVMGYGFVKK